MNAPPNLFTDGKAYERLMGRWSQVAGAKFLDWLDSAERTELDRCRLRQWRLYRSADCARRARAVTGIDPSDGQIVCAHAAGAKLAQFRVADAQACRSPTTVSTPPRWRWSSLFPIRSRRRAKWRVWSSRAALSLPICGTFPGGGFPIRPLSAAMKSLGLRSRRGRMSKRRGARICERFGNRRDCRSIDTTVIRIRVAFADFDDFWEFSSLPVGPSGKALAATVARRAASKSKRACANTADRRRRQHRLRGFRQCREGPQFRQTRNRYQQAVRLDRLPAELLARPRARRRFSPPVRAAAFASHLRGDETLAVDAIGGVRAQPDSGGPSPRARSASSGPAPRCATPCACRRRRPAPAHWR